MKMEMRRWWALTGLMLAILVVSMDGTILSVASPTLATSLHASESQLQWFSSGYLLVLAAAVLPMGRLGDRVGHRRVLLGSVVVFGVCSLMCALATTPEEFLGARLAMGAAGAGITVMALSVLTVLFDEQDRPKAVGVYQGVNFLALPLGPVLGGWLLTHFWWGWVFLINVPIALAAIAVTSSLVPESKAPGRIRFDAVGIVISTAGLTGATYGLIAAGQNGWTSPLALPLIATGVVVFLAFLLWERRVIDSGGQPLLELGLFRSPAFAWGAILSGTVGLAMAGVLFVMPQFFQGVQGTTAIVSGLRLLPLICGLALGASGADQLARVVGWQVATAGGFVVTTAGALWGAGTHSGSGSWFIGAWMFVFGTGIGIALATSSSAALSQLTEANSGSGSAIVQLIQKLSAPFGSAILGSVVSAVYIAHLGGIALPAEAVSVARQSVFAGVAAAERAGSPDLLRNVQDAFTSGLSVSLLVSAGLAATGVILAIVVMPGRRQPKGLVSTRDDDGKEQTHAKQ